MELVMEQEAPAGEVCLTPEAMDAYLDTLRQQGRSADTLAAYRRSIYGLYRSLPPDKRVGRGTLDRWRETLEDQGYLPRTINVRLAAANGLMTYLGHRELQATAALPPPAEGERPELTPRGVSASAVHRPGSGEGAALPAGEGIRQHRACRWGSCPG